MPTLDDLMPYDAPRRDLASHELWQRSLRRSRHRRDLAVISRRERTRRKGVSAVVSAAMVTAPAAPTLAAAAGGSGGRAAAAQTSGGDVPVVLRAGSTGPGVEALQRALGITDDGIFGPQTEAALRAFQARNGLSVTGVVDAATWAQLFGTSVSVVDESSPLAQEVMASAGASGATARTSSVATTAGARTPAGDGPAPSSKSTNGTPQVQGDATPAPRQSAPGNSGSGSSGDGSSGSAPTPQNQTNSSPTDSTPAPTPNPGSGGSCGSGDMGSPVTGYTVTGVFGENRGDHVHSGLDMAVPSGTPIRAASCGTVASASYEGGYGNMVCINHSGGYSTCYAHMSRFAVGAGQYVRIGQIIGYVGCSGNCSGPHVHFEVRYHGSARDPQPYLKRQAKLAGGRATSATRVAVYKTPTRSKAQTARAARVSGRGGFSTIAKGAAPQAQAEPAAQGGQQASSTTAAPAPAPAPGDQTAPPAEAQTTDQRTAEAQPTDAQPTDQQASDSAAAETTTATGAVDTTSAAPDQPASDQSAAATDETTATTNDAAAPTDQSASGTDTAATQQSASDQSAATDQAASAGDSAANAPAPAEAPAPSGDTSAGSGAPAAQQGGAGHGEATGGQEQGSAASSAGPAEAAPAAPAASAAEPAAAAAEPAAPAASEAAPAGAGG